MSGPIRLSRREVLTRIRAEQNINVQPSLVRRLVDFGVLVAAD